MEQRADKRNDRLAKADLTAALFVPADRPDRVTKAVSRGAHAVVIDLEDAVAGSAKAAARTGVVAALAERSENVCYLVRVNGVHDGEHLRNDLEALSPVLGDIDALVLPKATSASDVIEVETMLASQTDVQTALIPTIESARGVANCFAIAAASPGVFSLLFGPMDLSAELGTPVTAGGLELLTARSTVVLACAAAGLAAPLDGPWPTLGDQQGLMEATRRARQLGYAGKVAIHPNQLDTITTVFAPTPEELIWAREVTVTYSAAVSRGVGAIQMSDGTFIDPPIAQRAQAILSRADRTGAST